MLRYRVGNWAEYNKSLIARGSLTLWVSDDVLSAWQAPQRKGKNGHPFLYSDDAILCLCYLRFWFSLTLRSTQGFAQSLFMLMGISLPVPSYTQICRRAQKLCKILKKLSKRLPKAIIVDSSGLKVFGEGEWHTRTHGKSKRRRWHKIHIGTCPASHEIIVALDSDSNCTDGEIFPQLLRDCPRTVQAVYGDGAYDSLRCRQAIHNRGARAHIPPRRNARYRGDGVGWRKDRNAALSCIAGLGGDQAARKLWKKLSGYHRRSLVETAFSRFKGFFGANLRSRTAQSRGSEIKIKCMIQNMVTRLGMPDSYPIQA